MLVTTSKLLSVTNNKNRKNDYFHDLYCSRNDPPKIPDSEYRAECTRYQTQGIVQNMQRNSDVMYEETTLKLTLKYFFLR
jgi:hypothetical protein